MEELILYNDKEGNLMNCGFKLQTDGIKNFGFVNNNKEVKDMLTRLTAPSGLYVNNKSTILDNTNYIHSEKDIFDNLLELQATIDNKSSLPNTKKKSSNTKKNIQKSKKTTRKRKTK